MYTIMNATAIYTYNTNIKIHSLEEGDNELERGDPLLLELPRTFRVALAATAKIRKQQQPCDAL